MIAVFSKVNKGRLLRQENQWTVFVTSDKTQDFKRKLESWKTWICHHELDNFPIRKRLFDGCDLCCSKKCDFVNFVDIAYLKYFHVWKILHSSVNHYFPNDQCTMLGNPALAKKSPFRASQVAQWLRICLLMQGTRVRALAWEDPTCRRAAGPVSHNC